MRLYHPYTSCRAFVCLVCMPLLVANSSARTIISGSGIDGLTEKPLSPATIRVRSTNVSTMTNQDGRFEILVPDLPTALVCSHIRFCMDTLSVGSAEVVTVVVGFVRIF